MCATRGAFPVPLQTAVPRTSLDAVGEPGPRCCAAHLGRGGIAGAWAKKAFQRPVLLTHEGEHFGGGFQASRPPAKQQGPGSQRQPSPALPDGERRAVCENSLHCFPEQRCGLGLFVFCEERFLRLCRLQPPGARLVQLGRCGLGSQRPSLPRGSMLWLGQRRFLHAQS